MQPPKYLPIWACLTAAVACSEALATVDLNQPPDRPLVREADRLPLHEIAVELRDLLREREFDRLNREISRHVSRWRAGEFDDLEIEDITSHLSGVDKDLLSAWIRHSPQSGFAHWARGEKLAAIALQHRGTAYASKTPQWRFDKMYATQQLAIADLNAAIELNPRWMPAYAELLEIARTSGKHEFGPDVHARAVSIDPGSYPVHMARLTALFPQWGGSFDAMASYTEEVLRANPDRHELYVLWAITLREIASAYGKRGDLARQLELLDQAAQWADLLTIAHHRAWVLKQLKRPDEALAEVNRAIEMAAHHGPVLALRAMLHMEAGRDEAELRDREELVKLEPGNWSYTEDLRRAYERRKDVPGQLKAILAGLHLGGGRGWKELGKLYLWSLQRAPEAEAALRMSVSLNENDRWAWYNLGQALQQQGNSEAAGAFEHFLARSDRTNPDHQTWIARAEDALFQLRRLSAEGQPRMPALEYLERHVLAPAAPAGGQ